ncbi:MAG TPA: BON domain-containing protein [Mycobacteriales bacterium]|nr:BON domain-containing protein [Mycobacteriales bacterium]
MTAISDDMLGPPAKRADCAIAAAAAHAIERDPLLPRNRILLTVCDGWVTLHGEVSMSVQRQDAERDVARIQGVCGITNLVNVSSEPTVSATHLKERIDQAMLRTAEEDARNVTVEVQRAKVVLEGLVHSWAERHAAERAAWTAPGVDHVENRIKVRFFGD